MVQWLQQEAHLAKVSLHLTHLKFIYEVRGLLGMLIFSILKPATENEKLRLCLSS
jgi:hypothetical protein